MTPSLCVKPHPRTLTLLPHSLDGDCTMVSIGKGGCELSSPLSTISGGIFQTPGPPSLEWGRQRRRGRCSGWWEEGEGSQVGKLCGGTLCGLLWKKRRLEGARPQANLLWCQMLQHSPQRFTPPQLQRAWHSGQVIALRQEPGTQAGGDKHPGRTRPDQL